ncbi:hypothetical protein BDV96DRAFT_580455 [Lophiotrema nucula]|uniref:Uncharacterized protein n=1 Tax=Lophiotrema nucula TaxID=690887 RepID=A0A6A5Z1K0_9PLEO|nr:hypothetical protein BDV96DRAFT_580455 [Lophiotrema nucula]
MWLSNRADTLPSSPSFIAQHHVLEHPSPRSGSSYLSTWWISHSQGQLQHQKEHFAVEEGVIVREAEQELRSYVDQH